MGLAGQGRVRIRKMEGGQRSHVPNCRAMLADWYVPPEMLPPAQPLPVGRCEGPGRGDRNGVPLRGKPAKRSIP